MVESALLPSLAHNPGSLDLALVVHIRDFQSGDHAVSFGSKVVNHQARVIDVEGLPKNTHAALDAHGST